MDESANIIGVVTGKIDTIAPAKFTGDLAENVNFAIKGNVAGVFLDTHDIKYNTLKSLQKLSVVDIASTSETFTLFVRCKN